MNAKARRVGIQPPIIVYRRDGNHHQFLSFSNSQRLKMSFIIKDIRVFTGEEIIESGSVYVNLNGSVEYVGSECPSVPGVPIMSRPGSTLLPGLIDAHIHADEATAVALEQSAKFGVTTVLDMANKVSTITKLKEISRTRKDVAQIMSAYAGAMIEGGWPAPVILAHGPTEEV